MYLDGKRLVALWREALLARKVLYGQTNGYRNHPQLDRFRSQPNPLAAIENYLWDVHLESQRRGYHFASSKLTPRLACAKIIVHTGQLNYEWHHLQQKINRRAATLDRTRQFIEPIKAHPLFRVIAGAIEPWERIKS